MFGIIGGTCGTLFAIGSIFNGIFSPNIMQYELASKIFSVSKAD